MPEIRVKQIDHLGAPSYVSVIDGYDYQSNPHDTRERAVADARRWLHWCDATTQPLPSLPARPLIDRYAAPLLIACGAIACGTGWLLARWIP